MDEPMRIWVFFSLISMLLLVGCADKPADRPPNILFILADDLGTDVPGCYGGSSYNTPSIDQLSKDGILFTHCYSAPLCSPSRVKLLTGRYGFRTGQQWGYIPPGEVTFGHILKKAGYKTAIAGKWQMALLKDDPSHIKKMGFDESCVFGWHEGPRYYDPLVYENGKILMNTQDNYGPDIFSDFLIGFMQRNSHRPFLAYYAMTLPHEISNDFDTPPPYGPKGRYETYRENVEYADKLVGKVVKALDELGIRDNTVILFSGDNGTPYHYITKYEDGQYVREPVYSLVNGVKVRGGKKFMTDAGTHVPLIVSWRGVSPAGTVNNDLVDFSDFMPTFAELAGTKPPADRVIDGHSFAPQIMGKKGTPRKWVYQEWEGEAWIRTQRWKLYEDGRLFDMAADPLEQRRIPAENDNKDAKKMRAFLENELANLKQ